MSRSVFAPEGDAAHASQPEDAARWRLAGDRDAGDAFDAPGVIRGLADHADDPLRGHAAHARGGLRPARQVHHAGAAIDGVSAEMGDAVALDPVPRDDLLDATLDGFARQRRVLRSIEGEERDRTDVGEGRLRVTRLDGGDEPLDDDRGMFARRGHQASDHCDRNAGCDHGRGHELGTPLFAGQCPPEHDGPKAHEHQRRQPGLLEHGADKETSIGRIGHRWERIARRRLVRSSLVRRPRTILAVTGSRNDYGVLRPVLRAIAAHPDLRLLVAAAGGHLRPPFNTVEEVRAEFDLATEIPMHLGGRADRLDDAAALGHGVLGFAKALDRLRPDVVLVLGDRLEALAAASAAAIGGIRVAHLHGGDRAEGVADELIRHAVTKLSHIHFPATARSTERILCFGEDPARVHLVGSPAVDGIDAILPLGDDAFASFGNPELILLLHGQGRDDAQERIDAQILIGICRRAGRTLLLHPNHDPGHDAIVSAIVESNLPSVAYLPREQFIALLKRVRALVGNSSSALIECAALGIPCVNVGPRQAGREKPPNVIDVPDWDARKIEFAVERALLAPPPRYRHPYGDGRCGEKTAAVLASFDPEVHSLTKRSTF